MPQNHNLKTAAELGVMCVRVLLVLELKVFFLGSRLSSQELKIVIVCSSSSVFFHSCVFAKLCASGRSQEFQCEYNEVLSYIFGAFGSLVYRKCILNFWKNEGWGGSGFLLCSAFVLVWLCVKFVKLVLWVFASESLGFDFKGFFCFHSSFLASKNIT